MSRGLRSLIALVVIAVLAGCGGKKPASASRGSAPGAGSELTEEELFQRGKDLVGRGKHADGRVFLRRYEQRFPKGPHVEEAKILLADSFFLASEPDQQVEGVALYRQFLTFFPRSTLACVAQLRIGEYYFRQMHGCERDQSETRQAVDEFQKLLATFPNCTEAATAREKLALAYDRLACAELKVADFYLRTNTPKAAEHRLQDLLKNYSESSSRCRARRLLIQLLEERGALDEARAELIRMEAECAASEELVKARRTMGVASPRTTLEPPPAVREEKKKK